ncbi:MAG TPA: LPS-assembly protein LptD [Burkholderiaceae bacterium]|nr:LPS-assembly protein LptD [Burkholderiaceae bacterium]
MPVRIVVEGSRQRLRPVAAAVLVLVSAGAAAQSLPGAELTPSRALKPPSRDTKVPVILQADEIRGRPELDAEAIGNVELRRGSTIIRADRLTYEAASDLAKAHGNVRITEQGNLFSGPEAQLQLERFEGYFLQPDYFFELTQAGGHAQRIDFIDENRMQAQGATYTSCPRDGSGDPAWLLSADRIKLDLETNTGVAEGARLRFYGVPILGAPAMSFPLSDARKSGLLPPLMTLDSKSGLVLGVPYYWNIAPNRDATFTPTIMTRRGLGLDTEFRYLEPSYGGRIDLNLLPNDRVAGRSRHALLFQHEGTGWVNYRANVLRVSDDAYWRDFPRAVPSITPRLLPLDLQADRALPSWGGGEWSAYSRVQRWQPLNDANLAPSDPNFVTPPYDRAPQLGLRGGGRVARWGRTSLDYSLETEVNRFVLSDGSGTSVSRPTDGMRIHAVGSVALPIDVRGAWLKPKLAFNAASYHYDFDDLPGGNGRSGSASRVIPTFSVDAGMAFERNTTWFGRPLRQTLEPRVLYVRTPFRDQSQLPNFDAAGKDFNDISIFSENSFSGIDRVSDANLLTAGVMSRWLDADTGAEAMRLGVAQRVLFSPQKLTPEGTPLTQHLSDLLLLASSKIWPRWTLDASVQYNPETHNTERSLIGVRYSPGPFRTVNVNYRMTRGSTEQVEVGWQWPIYRRTREQARPNACGGDWYGVGRVNYSLRDKRLTDSIAGIEYDAGCWIGRVVVERLSTGHQDATSRLVVQLEFVGLSRLNLGANPLRLLRDNIPGYRLLREDRNERPSPVPYE